MRFYRQTKKYLFISFLSLVLAGLVISIFFGEWFSLAEIQKYTMSLGLWLPISFTLIYILLSVFFPTTPFMILAGLLFGFRYGLLYTTIAGFVSAFLTFYISRTLGKGLVDELLKASFLDKIEKLDEKIAKHGFLTIIILRILPIMPFNILNIFMGVSKVKTRDYAAGTILGLAPSNILAVYLGSIIVSALL
jgi:uncharacterized membrane protein YdjX (TVP38/TMEM64 family)